MFSLGSQGQNRKEMSDHLRNILQTHYWWNILLLCFPNIFDCNRYFWQLPDDWFASGGKL